ncbi:MAG: hypothetical protein V1703_00570 [Candidatus Altiarchaeota archaeon]
MFDDLYTQCTKRVDYRVLMAIPPILTLLLVLFTLYNGVQLGMDFKGGTWMDIITDVNVDSDLVNSITKDLISAGLEEPKVYMGQDIESGKNKVSIATASVVDKTIMYGIITKYIPDLRDSDVATVAMEEPPPGWLEFKISSRFNGYVELNYTNKTLTIKAINLDEKELESVLKYNLNQDYDVNLNKKNFNLREVGPTLGQTFRGQGIKAIFLSFVLMALVVFFAFKVFVPSVAVLQAAVCDVLLAVAGMSIFNIPFDSASLGALLMLIGYSVDTDILLTVRLLHEKVGEVDEGINKAMKTGIMMTSTTVGAMLVTILVTTFLIQIQTLNTIATVLMFGLIGDVFTTWWTNAGLLKWYLGRPRTAKKKSRFNIFKD